MERAFDLTSFRFSFNSSLKPYLFYLPIYKAVYVIREKAGSHNNDSRYFCVKISSLNDAQEIQLGLLLSFSGSICRTQ